MPDCDVWRSRIESNCLALTRALLQFVVMILSLYLFAFSFFFIYLILFYVGQFQ